MEALSHQTIVRVRHALGVPKTGSLALRALLWGIPAVLSLLVVVFSFFAAVVLNEGHELFGLDKLDFWLLTDRLLLPTVVLLFIAAKYRRGHKAMAALEELRQDLPGEESAAFAGAASQQPGKDPENAAE